MSYVFQTSTNPDSSLVDSMLKWAKNHCKSYITCDSLIDLEIPDNRYQYGYRYKFYFSDEQDYVMFNIKWAS